MNIDDLNKSLSEMTESELFNHLHGIRQNRRAKPKPKAQQIPKKAKKVNVPKLSDAERERLIKELENEIGDNG